MRSDKGPLTPASPTDPVPHRPRPLGHPPPAHPTTSDRNTNLTINQQWTPWINTFIRHYFHNISLRMRSLRVCWRCSPPRQPGPALCARQQAVLAAGPRTPPAWHMLLPALAATRGRLFTPFQRDLPKQGALMSANLGLCFLWPALISRSSIPGKPGCSGRGGIKTR